MADEGFADPQTRFIEEVMLRSERAFRSIEESMGKHALSFQELTEEIRDHRREFREEYEAQRGTLLAILDRLDLIDPREGPAAEGPAAG